jgi:4-hydroxy-2-oxoheptanedioate aldolase
VKAAKYPSKEFPGAFRGSGAMFAPANFNQTGREYLFSANENVMVCVQIETRLAIENVEAIASVPGIDMLFIGPNDLAGSLGYVAFDHATIPEVQEATKKVLAAANKAGKYAGYFAMSADAAAQKYQEGWQFMNCGADIVAITAWMTNEMASMKSIIAKSEGKTEENKEAGAKGGYN